MLKYAKVINAQTKLCEVGLGTDSEFYLSVGMTEQDVEQAWDGNWYLTGFVPVKPVPTDAEVLATRESLYPQADRLFNSYDQGGPNTLAEAIAAKAQIQFDNKKSDQTAMTLDDFIHKVSREYELANSRNVANDDLSYKYQESNGIDPISVGSETINLIRTPIGVEVSLPKISKVQLVKIDNVSEDEIQLVANAGDSIDGANQLVVPAKSIVEVIANKVSSSWDIYSPALEIESESTINVSDLLGNTVKVKNLQFGMGMKLVKESEDTARVELDLASLGIADEPPCYYASIANNEKLTDDIGNVIHTGRIWYDDVIVSNKTNYFDFDKDNKAIGIQEPDDLDPNVTGGMPYLVIFRDVMSGTAPEDGFIESAVRDRDSQDIIADANGIPFAVYRGYSAKEKYKTIRIAAIVEAKNLVYLQHDLIDNFATKGSISLQPYTRGNSCVCIQGLSADNRSGRALTKYEIDTGERVLIDKVWDEDAKKFTWILRGFETADETQMKFVDDRAILFNPKPKGTPYRFSLTNTYKKVPFGIVKSGTIPFDFARWTNTEGYEYGNENNLVADDDMNITVLGQPNLHAVIKEPVFMCLTEKVGEDYVPIQGTEVSYLPKADHEVAPKFPLMKAKIKNGQIIGVAMKSTSPNGAYIETDSPQYSLITFTIDAKGAI
jgi:hypothetical protein